MTVPITGTLAPYPGGPYPTHDSRTGLGGLREVADHAARNAIPSFLRRVGMEVVCTSDALGTWWQLNTGTNTGTDADWTEFTGSPGATPPSGGGADLAWGLALGAPAAVASDLALWETVQASGTFARWDLTAKTGPVGAALIVDILLSTDHGATFASLWALTPANRPTIAAGAVFGTGTAFDTAAYSAGNVLRIDIVQVGSTTAGSNIGVRLK